MKRARTLLLAAGLAGLAACASVPVEEVPKQRLRPLPSYAADPFVPINLYLNSNEQVTGTLSDLIQYTAEQLRESGAFIRVDRGVQRWPITLQARYQLTEDSGEGDTTRRVLGLLSLGLVPVHVSQTHTLFAEVLTEPDSVAALELSVTVRERVSLYDLVDSARGERAAADDLLERLLAEVAQRKLIPRWAAFKPDLKKKPAAEPVRLPT